MINSQFPYVSIKQATLNNYENNMCVQRFSWKLVHFVSTKKLNFFFSRLLSRVLLNKVLRRKVFLMAFNFAGKTRECFKNSTPFLASSEFSTERNKRKKYCCFFSVISLITESEIIAQSYVETCFSDRSYNLFIFHIKLRHSMRLTLINDS